MKAVGNLLTLYILLIFISSINSFEGEEVITNRDDFLALINSREFEEYIVQQEEEDVVLKSIFGGNECLVSKSEATSLLKSQYNVVNSSPDENLRFILGKCNPVLLIPGVYATKLVVEVQCKAIAQKERTTLLKDIRVFCGDTICPDESVEREEHPLFISLLDDAFSILGTNKNKYSSCLGYFMNYFQNPNECPTVNNEKTCLYSPYIKVGFYGGTTKTKSDGRCGIEGIQDVIQSGKKLIDDIVNIGAAKSYETMSKKLIDRGYKEGFSLGGIPNDYRRFLATNNFSKKAFRSQIERLYTNTGKPVVVIGHSYGTLLALTNLVRTENKDLLPKIKKYIAIAPPYAGSTVLLDIYLHGMNEWNKSFDILGKQIKITNYNIFGQNMMYKSLPTLSELRPLPIAAKLLTDTSYKEFGDAIKERIAYENKCRKTQCSDSTTKFDRIFKGHFPSISDSECAFENIEDTEETFGRKCFTNLYNVGDCPTILTKTSDSNPYGTNIENYCGQKKTGFYFQGPCNGANDENCLDNIYSEKGPYAFSNIEAVNSLINRYNENFAQSIDGKKIDASFFETKEQVSEGKKKSIEYNDNISLIKDLPAPPVDTDVVYASYAKTTTAFVLKESDFTEKGDIFEKGGDTTVPSWSSLLTGLKWIYDKQKQNLQPKYKLVEYCSRLSQKGKYTFDPNSEQDFIALGCSCLNKKNVYKSIDDCTHAAMINDDTLIEYVMSVVDDPKIANTVTDSKKAAVKIYNPDNDYESKCNSDLYNLLETAK